jgi:hypothetical protein
MTSAVESIVANEVEDVPQNEIGSNRPFGWFELKNNPNRVFDYRDMHDPYIYGSTVFLKLYLENRNFFKTFSQLLHSHHQQYDNQVNLISLVAQAVPTVEGQNTLEWFAGQYAFLFPLINKPQGWSANPSMEFGDVFGASSWMSVLGSMDNNSGVKNFNFSLWADYDKVPGINVKLYDSSGNMVANCNKNKANAHSADDCALNQPPSDYVGSIKAVITEGSDPGANQIVQFYPFSSKDSIDLYWGDIPIIGLAIGGGQRATITNIDTNFTSTVDFNRGMFIFRDENLKSSGRYKVDVVRAMNTCTDGACHLEDRHFVQYFNKVHGTYFVKVSTSAPLCMAGISNIVSSSAESEVYSTSTDYCGRTLMLNSVPVFRAWDKNLTFRIGGLSRSTSYSFALKSFDDNGISQRIVRQTKTRSADPLTASYGFFRNRDGGGKGEIEITTNNPINTETLSCLKLYESSSIEAPYGWVDSVPETAVEIPADVTLVDSRKILIKTRRPMVPGTVTMISKNGWVRDMYGNSLIFPGVDVGINFLTVLLP